MFKSPIPLSVGNLTRPETAGFLKRTILRSVSRSCSHLASCNRSGSSPTLPKYGGRAGYWYCPISIRNWQVWRGDICERSSFVTKSGNSEATTLRFLLGTLRLQIARISGEEAGNVSMWLPQRLRALQQDLEEYLNIQRDKQEKDRRA